MSGRGWTELVASSEPQDASTPTSPLTQSVRRTILRNTGSVNHALGVRTGQVSWQVGHQ